MIDVGANLTSRQFHRDLPQVLRRAAQAGVSAIVVTGTSTRASTEAVRLARRFPQVATATAVKNREAAPDAPLLFATVGVHPHEAYSFVESETPAELRALIAEGHGVVVAVGECGLDFHRDLSARAAQERAFRAQVELACELRLPLFLHERAAHEAFLDVLEPFRRAQRLPPAVVHCFTGSERELRAYVERGYYVGVTGFVCMDSRGLQLRSMVALVPLDRLLVETDAPYMYPYGSRGGKRARCEPKDVRAVVETLASCYGVPADEIARRTASNARRFFRLELHSDLAAGSDGATAGSCPASDRPPPAPIGPPLEPEAAAAALPAGAVSLDGGSGEGGGQLLRVSMALAALLRRAVRVHSIRAGRKLPGLRSQHLASAELARAAAGGRLTGAHLNSTALTFDASDCGGAGERGSPLGGDGRTKLSAASRTGGSVALMAQGVLPIALFGRRPVDVALEGGTHVAFSPPVDFMQVPLPALLSRFGARVGLRVERRMFRPGTGAVGRVELSVEPLAAALAPVDLSAPSSRVDRVFARVTVMGPAATASVAQQHVDALESALAAELSAPAVDWDVVLEPSAPDPSGRPRRAARGGRGPGQTAVALLCVGHTDAGGILAASRTSTFAGEAAASAAAAPLALELAGQLAALVRSGVCVDEHLADNAVVFMALASGTSRLRIPRRADRTSDHLETALDVARRVAGARVRVREERTSAVVEVDGIGLAPCSQSGE